MRKTLECTNGKLKKPIDLNRYYLKCLFVDVWLQEVEAETLQLPKVG